ncbi:MAG: phosphoribosylformylglycinamidine cyclo-ligase [Bdellovibrionia bacterium]
MNYKKAGGDALVDWLKSQPADRGPQSKNLLDGIGGFAALFKLDLTKYKKPVLVSSTDGVGTKVKLASYFKSFDGVGQDLVAMCVNDLICCGGTPLFFLDYYATGKLQLEEAKAFLGSVRRACQESDCLLIGGETAEMPGVYHDGDFDCAGFAVGVVDEDRVIGAQKVQVGDIAIGVSSSGFHSNGFSLIRKVFAEDLDKWRDVLMKPTNLYARLAMELHSKDLVHAMANITGGGIENIPRVMPEGTKLRLKHWDWPAEFLEVQKRTKMTKEEMLRTLNCGLGFVLVAPSENSAAVKLSVVSHGFKAFELGVIERGEGEARVEP